MNRAMLSEEESRDCQVVLLPAAQALWRAAGKREGDKDLLLRLSDTACVVQGRPTSLFAFLLDKSGWEEDRRPPPVPSVRPASPLRRSPSPSHGFPRRGSLEERNPFLSPRRPTPSLAPCEEQEAEEWNNLVQKADREQWRELLRQDMESFARDPASVAHRVDCFLSQVASPPSAGAVESVQRLLCLYF